MKGVILAGGKGTRLLPLTNITNKHLLPIYNKVMIEYPLNTLLKAGIKDILIISGGDHICGFVEYLGSGKKYHANFTYKTQEEAGGTAQALSLAEHFVGQDSIMVIMGDQILEDDFSKALKTFKKGAKIFVKEVVNPERFSVAVLDGKSVISIVEKPAKSPTPYALAGIFLYDPDIFKIIKNIKPSPRGELEITDANIAYLKNRSLEAEIIKGFWIDTGTFETLSLAAKWAENRNKKA